MSTIYRPKLILAATAALAAIPATSALLANHNAHATHIQQLGRPSLLPLEANQQPFSELDKLKAKRLSLRRRVVEAEVEAAVESHDAVDDLTNNSLTSGLEYLYEATDERSSDDLFHLILMPSTFKKDHMSIENTAASCTAILGIPTDKAQDLSLYAKHQGFSCLGTWTHEECLAKGKELSSKDLDCRIIPLNGATDAEVESEVESNVVVMDVLTQKAMFESAYLLTLDA
eukprot:CAMPEP_0201628282 /NCGR_PEP_ID=MMETSP0493-20130528/3268_1 /ASSEMBLY_ACC=CAM_ASM_000838 /TAXON_ID=420259 /ORGANISM="Thalassiosira gravida, Strain GMp14c1" /LENGTH=229 /DNA_ID=CAMNT_0048098995 /DNA_START=123 /DNA_END=812 /DNA_ORIENTATION=-